jgi:hypothetical protein
MVAHDWPDDRVVQILRQLRIAASRESHLVIADYVAPFASRTNSPKSHLIKTHSSMPDSPSPLLANFGKASANIYYMDVAVSLLWTLLRSIP